MCFLLSVHDRSELCSATAEHSRCTSLHWLRSRDTLIGGASPSAAPAPLDVSRPLVSLRRCSRRAWNHYYWIHPSGLRSSINACPFLPADPLGGAAVHWRQRAPFRSRTRDRQSSYKPQLRCTCTRSSRRSAISRRLPLVDSRSDARCVLARSPGRGPGRF